MLKSLAPQTQKIEPEFAGVSVMEVGWPVSSHLLHPDLQRQCAQVLRDPQNMARAVRAR